MRVETQKNNYIVAIAATYQYPQNGFAISPFSLTLQSGEIAFFVGPNGSGKSTLCRLLAGILKPTDGQVQIANKLSSTLSLGEIGCLLGYLWQKPELQLFAPTVLEEMTFTALLMGQSLQEAEAKAQYWLDYFKLSHLKTEQVFTLSGGEKQRLALAAVLSYGAKFLILDEPSKFLDKPNKKHLIELLLRLKAENIGMAIISHDRYFFEALADRKLEMKEGAIIADQYLRP